MNFGPYYSIVKPGIIRGNAITAAAGFLLASKGSVDLGLLIALLLGSSLVMAGACTLNNYIDRGIDGKMKRTQQRVLVIGAVPGNIAVIYALALTLIGFTILYTLTNALTATIGLIGFIDYVIIYGFAKRRTHHATLIGTIAGATPPVAGYVAVTNGLDATALLLFVILVFWQMPHFYAIAIRRMREYKLAKLPMLPLVKGVRNTKIQMNIYAVGFILSTTLLYISGVVGYAYLIIMLAVGLGWQWIIYQGFKAPNDQDWAKRVFVFSLIVLLTFSILISLNSYLPGQ